MRSGRGPPRQHKAELATIKINCVLLAGRISGGCWSENYSHSFCSSESTNCHSGGPRTISVLYWRVQLQKCARGRHRPNQRKRVGSAAATTLEEAAGRNKQRSRVLPSNDISFLHSKINGHALLPGTQLRHLSDPDISTQRIFRRSCCTVKLGWEGAPREWATEWKTKSTNQLTGFIFIHPNIKQ